MRRSVFLFCRCTRLEQIAQIGHKREHFFIAAVLPELRVIRCGAAAADNMAFQLLLRNAQQQVFHRRLRARALHVADKVAERVLQAQAVRTDAARVPAERKCILRQRLNSRFL